MNRKSKIPGKVMVEREKKVAIAKRLAALPAESREMLTEKLKEQGIDIWELPIVAIEQEKPPLSSAQKRLWFLEQMEPGNTQYNLFSGLEFHGELEYHSARKVS